MKASWLLLLAFAPQPGSAQDLARLQACRSESDSLRRLACYDDIALPAAAPASTDPHEAAKRTLDRMLAQTLKDPASAQQYSASAPAPCKAVIGIGDPGTDCICYEVNARNAMGGMTGKQIGVAFNDMDPANPVSLPLPDGMLPEAAVAGCLKLGLQPRDPQLIHAQIR